MKVEKNSLLRKLKLTILGLGVAMIAMWLLFYININGIIQRYTMQNMEQVSQRIISELNQSFLQLEEISFAMAENEVVRDFIITNDSLQFHTKAFAVEKLLEGMHNDAAFAENIILYNDQGRFYRFSGNLSNTSILRIIKMINGGNVPVHIQLPLEGVNYIGYVSSINDGKMVLGRIAMLIDENEIIQLFHNLEGNENMKIALAADHTIIVATEASLLGRNTSEFLAMTTYTAHKQVGFTPFQLLISYENSNHEINYYFLIAMILMAIMLLLVLEVFIRFWRNKFFEPIQKVISEVEGFEGGKSDALAMTGLEHFDGLVKGINDMAERIEQKEKELLDTTISLQEIEIKKQRALIISLKKQISAHFTVNVLNIIKALAATGKNEKAGLLCDGLSFLLRYANAGDTFIEGMDEFFVLNKYINIMEIRYPEKFNVEIDIEDYLEDIKLPRMLLQPIIENSILHGFIETDMESIGMIHVYSILETKCIKIVVEDNGGGMDERKLRTLQMSIIQAAKEDDVEVEGLSHVALVNIQRRILSYFGEDYGIEIESVKTKGTKVTLTLPRI